MQPKLKLQHPTKTVTYAHVIKYYVVRVYLRLGIFESRMSGIAEGSTHALRSATDAEYLKTGNPGMVGGGTYTGTSTEPSLAQYENIFGPAGRDIKIDQQRHKRHQRWHLPDALKGHNQYLTDRIDGLITDKTDSPFTRNILPYVYLENPDQKLKWNVYSFDEGIASRVPYEAAARVLPQTKRSFAGYTIRQGLAIAMEHNFMVSAAGRENFKNQLTQLVGSIQMTNDLDVHVALLQAPSYQRHINEKYHDNKKNASQLCREYVDLFGIMQKIPNALDWLIEDAKNHLKTWGSQPPTFLLCNGGLTTQLTMIPEKTNYVTNGPDGLRRLAQGPDLPSYRGLSIINSRKFSMDAGAAPRDLLKRRVRVAEYYRIPYNEDNENREYEFYDQSRDTMFRLSWKDLQIMSNLENNAQHDMLMDDGKWAITAMRDDKAIAWDSLYDCQCFSMPSGGRIKFNKGTTMIHNVTSCTHETPKEVDIDPRNQQMCVPVSDRKTSPITSQTLFDIGGVDYALGCEMKGGLLQRDVFSTQQNKKVFFSNHAQNASIVNSTNFKFLFDSISDHQLPSHQTSLVNNNILYVIWYVVKIVEQLCATQTVNNIPTTDELKANIHNAHGCKALPAMMDLNIAWEEDFFTFAEKKDSYKDGGDKGKNWNLLTKTGDWSAEDTTHANSKRINHDEHRSALIAHIAKGLRGSLKHDFIGKDLLQLFKERKLELNEDTNSSFYPLSFFIGKLAYDIWYRYHKMMLGWASAIAHDRHSKKTIDGIHSRVHELSDVFLTDLVYQQFAYTCHSESHKAMFHFADYLEHTALFVADVEFKELFHNATMAHEKSMLISNNVHQALTSQQCYARPNLHLNNITPLCDDDMQTSCTSMDLNAWLIQAVAGMTYLPYDVCRMLMTSVADSNFAGKVAQMFTSDSQSMPYINEKMATSLLMVLWLQSEHYDKDVRLQAKQIYDVPNTVKRAIAKAVADCIKHNDTTSADLSAALRQLNSNTVRNKKTNNVAPFNHAVASDTQMFFAQAVANNSDDWPRQIPIQYMPCCTGDDNFTFAHAQAKPDTNTIYGAMCNNNTKQKARKNDKGYVSGTSYDKGYVSWSQSEMVSDRYQWLRALQDEVFPASRLDTYSYMLNLDYSNKEMYDKFEPALYDSNCALEMQAAAVSAYCECAEEECFRLFINVLAQRFFNASSRFFNNGRGLPQVVSVPSQASVTYSDMSSSNASLDLRELSKTRSTSNSNKSRNTPADKYVMLFGLHFMVGPKLAVHDDMHASGKHDIIILRPNIEHEMLGIIMGRGGTQELGSTFWGQTELSCYDDAQHGIWGMSYKYHERAMVTNERNLIRVFDVAFDGYNGGMDQSFVNWNDPRSINEFRQATYARDQPYNGPSMLVMQLPALADSKIKTTWPNPIVFQQNANGNLTPDPQKDHNVTNLQDNMVFNAAVCPKHCDAQIQAKYEQYMSRLEMHQWASIDQNSRPAGECCVGNETSSSMLAFQGTMKVYKDGREMEHTQGSGHLGPSFVGVASVREGRGLQNSNGLPSMVRQI